MVFPVRSRLLEVFAPRAAAVLVLLLVFGLVGGWILAGRMLAPLARITDATRTAAAGSLSHRIEMEGREAEFRELAPHGIRVNSVHPTNVDTDMIRNPAMYGLFSGGVPGADRTTAAAAMQGMHALPIPWVDPVDISNAVAWLASDEARYVTGVALPVDAGATAAFTIPHAPG